MQANGDNRELIVMKQLLSIAEHSNIQVKLLPLKANYGRLIGNHVYVKSDIDIEEINYNIAHELAHFFLHFDKGDTINTNKHNEYEEQADRAANLLLLALNYN